MYQMWFVVACRVLLECSCPITVSLIRDRRTAKHTQLGTGHDPEKWKSMSACLNSQRKEGTGDGRSSMMTCVREGQGHLHQRYWIVPFKTSPISHGTWLRARNTSKCTNKSHFKNRHIFHRHIFLALYIIDCQYRHQCMKPDLWLLSCVSGLIIISRNMTTISKSLFYKYPLFGVGHLGQAKSSSDLLLVRHQAITGINADSKTFGYLGSQLI